MNLKNKNVVVIGGSSGMGLAVARQAAEAGANVTICGRSEEKLKAAAVAIALPIALKIVDLGEEASVKQAIESIGPIDHLISTAANLTFAPVLSVTNEQIQSMLASKFWGPFFAAKYAAPHLAKDGSITFLSGLAAYRPRPGRPSWPR